MIFAQTGWLAVFLCRIFNKHFDMKATAAAILVGQVIRRSDKSVRKWRTSGTENKGVLPRSKQGQYKRRGVLRDNEGGIDQNGEEVFTEQFKCKRQTQHDYS